jgi:hypothetical protein
MFNGFSEIINWIDQKFNMGATMGQSYKTILSQTLENRLNLYIA